jgi:integrase
MMAANERCCVFAPVDSQKQITPATLHSLRRFFKTFCMDAGVPKPMVDAWLGHADQGDMVARTPFR